MIDYDIIFEPLTTPQVNVPISLVSQLYAEDGDNHYHQRTYTWTVIEPNGDRGEAVTDSLYIPQTDSQGKIIELTIDYLRDGHSLVSRVLYSEPVQTAVSIPVATMFNTLNASLEPNALAAGMSVILNKKDRKSLDVLTDATTSYQWQRGGVGRQWSDIEQATSVDYMTTIDDVDSQLRLAITIADDNDTHVVYSGVSNCNR